jgi:hypothetical protein
MKTTFAQLQTPANELTAAEELAAGHGGSYSVDPATGTVTLLHRTQPAVVRPADAPRNLPAADPVTAADQRGADFAG